MHLFKCSRCASADPGAAVVHLLQNDHLNIDLLYLKQYDTQGIEMLSCSRYRSHVPYLLHDLLTSLINSFSKL